MSIVQLRRKAKKTIDSLSGARLRFAAELLEYIEERESEEATRELLQIPGFAEDLKKSVKDVRDGKAVPWRKVRRDV